MLATLIVHIWPTALFELRNMNAEITTDKYVDDDKTESLHCNGSMLSNSYGYLAVVGLRQPKTRRKMREHKRTQQ